MYTYNKELNFKCLTKLYSHETLMRVDINFKGALTKGNEYKS